MSFFTCKFLIWNFFIVTVFVTVPSLLCLAQNSRLFVQEETKKYVNCVSNIQLLMVKESELQIWSSQTSRFQRNPARDYVFVFLWHHRSIEHVQKHLFPWSKIVGLVLAARMVRKTKSL